MTAIKLTNYLKSIIITLNMIIEKRQIAMKPIFIFIIMTYLFIPVACFAIPNALHVQAASDVVDIFISEYPDKQGLDDCQSSSFAEHTLSAYQQIDKTPIISLRGAFLIFLQPQVFIPIFVPPQNKS